MNTQHPIDRVFVRIASASEAPLVHALMLEAFDDDQFTLPSSALNETVDEVESAMRAGGAILAIENDTPIGSARFACSDRFTIARLGVVAAARGRGVGPQMVRWLEAHARDRGYAEVHADARSQQPDNRPWWSALGYAIVGYGSRYGVADLRTHMVKRLDGRSR